jgi:thioredoxin reductase
MGDPFIDVAIIGAGPYGLSIAAFLHRTNLKFRIFGNPMQSWRQNMPKGMLLKSDGFASSLYDPDSTFTLRRYCEEMNLPYADVGIPVPLETFAAYGLEFQRRLVPMLEECNITAVRRVPSGFELETAEGKTLQARKVVVAAGLTHFSYLPDFVSDLPREYVTHSFEHHDLSEFRGRVIAVIGGGASAADIAAILHEAGADVQLVVRREKMAFHSLVNEPRPLLQRIKNPRSGLGTGWRSRLCTDAPLIFHAMPQKFRLKVVSKHLGPAPGWFIRDKVVGKVPLHEGVQLKGAKVMGGKAYLKIARKDGSEVELAVDHIICATGFRVALSRLRFLEEPLQKEIRSVEDSPILSTVFESSVPGLHFVGAASANSFGPLTRFAFGAGFTAKRLSKHLAARR